MGRTLRCVFTAGAALTAFGRLEAASACSLDRCQAPIRLHTETYMPGNLVYFEVTALTPGSITLRTAAGDPIPAGIRTIGGDRVFAPEATIPPETDVVLEYELSCTDDGGAAPPKRTFEFRTGEASSIELRPARLFVAEYGVAYPDVENNERSFVRVGMDTPDLAHTATHLMTHSATVDGVPVSSWPMVGQFAQLEIGSQCAPQWSDVQTDSCGGLWSVPVGRHTVSVQTRVLGYDGDIAPVTIEVETRCPTDAAPPPDEPLPTGGDDDAVPEDDAAASDGASCAVARGPLTSARSSSAFAALTLVALGRVAWRRRSRRG